MASSPPGDDVCDYIVVGSGPGGGTVAARLAEAGWHVVLLEAGGDPHELAGGDALVSGGNRLPDDYDVPGFHPFAGQEPGAPLPPVPAEPLAPELPARPLLPPAPPLPAVAPLPPRPA